VDSGGAPDDRGPELEAKLTVRGGRIVYDPEGGQCCEWPDAPAARIGKRRNWYRNCTRVTKNSAADKRARVRNFQFFNL